MQLLRRRRNKKKDFKDSLPVVRGLQWILPQAVLVILNGQAVVCACHFVN